MCDAAQHVAALVQGRGGGCHRLLGVGRRGSSTSYSTAISVRGLARGLGVVGGDDRDRLALEADVAPRQHGLVGELEPVGLAARHVGVREHGAHARQRGGGAGVERQDQCARVRAAQRRAPQHPLHAHVGRVLELAAHLRDPVRALRAGCRCRRRPPAGARGGGAVTGALDRGEPPGRQLDRVDDLRVARAAAEVAGERLADVGLGGLRVAREQVVARDDQARGAEAALDRAGVDERLLDRVQLARRREPLDGHDLAALGLRGQHEAGADQRAVEVDRAGAALALLARVLGARQAEPLAQRVEQALAAPRPVEPRAARR